MSVSALTMRQPYLMWAGIAPLAQSSLAHRLQEQKRQRLEEERRLDRQRRVFVLVDVHTGHASRLYTLDEVMERLQQRSKSTIRRKAVWRIDKKVWLRVRTTDKYGEHTRTRSGYGTSAATLRWEREQRLA